jgi:hypothetical protein
MDKQEKAPNIELDPDRELTDGELGRIAGGHKKKYRDSGGYDRDWYGGYDPYQQRYRGYRSSGER